MTINTIAYYLGQYHPIPENDQFWGEGFSEWHNVARARPLFPGHKQPRIPGRLGFYDLRTDDTLIAQQKFAREIGVNCFCHWHYWMGGHRMLHRPLDRMLELPDQGVKFMLGWANESWTGAWHGLNDEIIVEQSYGQAELAGHARLLARYMRNDRYLSTPRGRPFLIYKPRKLIDPVSYLGELRDRVRSEAGVELYLIGTWGPGRSERFESPKDLGLDAAVINNVGKYYPSVRSQSFYAAKSAVLKRLSIGPELRPYTDTLKTLELGRHDVNGAAHSTIVTDWDNTPRSGRRGLVLRGYSPENFALAIRLAVQLEQTNDPALLFIKSWNEWAEGNTLEPGFNEQWSAADVFAAEIGRGSNQPKASSSIDPGPETEEDLDQIVSAASVSPKPRSA